MTKTNLGELILNASSASLNVSQQSEEKADEKNYEKSDECENTEKSDEKNTEKVDEEIESPEQIAGKRLLIFIFVVNFSLFRIPRKNKDF